MASGLGVGYKECCDCYKGRLRTTRYAVVAIGLAELHKSGFCGNLGRLRIHKVL